MAIKFHKHAVSGFAGKARVTYSAFNMASSGEHCVTIYAKDWQSGRVLKELFFKEYENNTDSMTDYFEAGRVRFTRGSRFYQPALEQAARAEEQRRRGFRA